jgi:UDPglucose 6-dehydrogenase
MPMKITVLGLWHLGCVTAAGCARHFNVTGLDFDPARIDALGRGQTPVSEPGLDDLIREGREAGRLEFSGDAAQACSDADVLWVCDDTPVDADDRADADFVISRIRKCLPHLPAHAVVLLSSQLPAGTCARLQSETGRAVCVSPENLRLGQALAVFQHPDRVVIGAPPGPAREVLAALFKPFSERLVWMSPVSAEVTKHALNGFLALSISYTNEVARICEAVGADAREVEEGLKSEARIGPRAYVSAGGPFAGGTLARDIVFMEGLGAEKGLNLDLIPSVKRSNDFHRQWELRHLAGLFTEPARTTIALLGLAYKSGTDTLRRSRALELARELEARGFTVRAFDPMIRQIPAEEGLRMMLCADAAACLKEADAAVLCTPWPGLRDLSWTELLAGMRQKVVLDAGRFLEQKLQNAAGCRYLCVERV